MGVCVPDMSRDPRDAPTGGAGPRGIRTSMRLVLITGAGASRNLSVDESEPIVLMDGWAAALRERFGPALSELLGLSGVVSGQDFEEHLGELTRWLNLKELNERFAWMTSGTDEGRDGQVEAFLQALRNAEARGARLERALDESLFDQFGPARFDARGAADAYSHLLADLGDEPSAVEMVCATTNYDRSLELALTELERPARTGLVYDGIRTPTLSASGLGSFQEVPSVLYLHGAVGWYRGDDGSIVGYHASDAYRPDLGRPAVLYPSRNKTIEDSAVATLWLEFERALAEATHVLVLGHGLADTHLVERLREVQARLAVTHLTEDDAATAERLLPRATRIQAEFGRTPTYDRDALRGWASDL